MDFCDRAITNATAPLSSMSFPGCVMTRMDIAAFLFNMAQTGVFPPMFGDKPKQLPQHFALIMVPEFTMMPVTSAIEPMRIANRLSEKALYKWTMHSVDGKPVAASNNILAMVDGDMTAIPDQATIIVCAGLNVQHHADKRLIA